MYGNNGTKQDQNNRSTNDMNNNFTDIEDKEIEGIAISPSGGSISSNGKQYQNLGPWDNSANLQYNSLQRPGNHLICSFCNFVYFMNRYSCILHGILHQIITDKKITKDKQGNQNLMGPSNPANKNTTSYRDLNMLSEGVCKSDNVKIDSLLPHEDPTFPVINGDSDSTFKGRVKVKCYQRKAKS